MGVVISVDSHVPIKSNGANGDTPRRNIILTDSLNDIVMLTLWGDLATNEGQLLEQLVASKPLIVLSQAKVTAYKGMYVNYLILILVVLLLLFISITKKLILK